MNNINYRKDQIPIMNYSEGTMAVAAVPGAGKTFIVTNLVAKLLLENKNKKGKILILTYMNSAVNNFKARIKKILSENDLESSNGFEVMTIHSLAVKIIKEKPEIMMLSDEFNIADDLQKSIILKECINNYRNKNEAQFRHFLKEQKDIEWQRIQLDKWQDEFYQLVSSTISNLKCSDISSKELNEKIGLCKSEILKIVNLIYAEYERKLKQNGLLDYDDLLIYAYKSLSQDQKLREKFQNRYTYVFEDECQDSNEIQGEIIKLICQEHNNLVRVGDVNQSITGTFSSSDPKFFKSFMEEAKYCHHMNMSNRSSQDILDVANRLVKYVCNELNQKECRQALQDININTVEKNQGYKENPAPDNYQVNVKWYKTWINEINETIRFTKGIQKKFPDKSIGILVPYNSQVSQVSKELEKEGLEFVELGPNSKNKRKVIDSIALIIDFINDCDNIDKLLMALSKVFIKTDNKEGKMDFINMLRNYSVEELLYSDIKDKPLILDDDCEMYKTFKYGIDSIVEILENSTIRADRLILFIKNKLIIEDTERAIVDYISFYIKYLLNDNPDKTLRDIYEILIDSYNKVFNHIIEVVYEINGYEIEPGSITVCNYHKSKGMEWDCVFLLQMTEYNFPDNINQKFQKNYWYLKDSYKNLESLIKADLDLILNGTVTKNHYKQTKVDLINEKIRILYVGITRAKEMLIMSGAEYKNEDDKKKYKQQVSLYLKILNELIQKERMGSK